MPKDAGSIPATSTKVKTFEPRPHLGPGFFVSADRGLYGRWVASLDRAGPVQHYCGELVKRFDFATRVGLAVA